MRKILFGLGWLGTVKCDIQIRTNISICVSIHSNLVIE
jgi:hypothetical protein